MIIAIRKTKDEFVWPFDSTTQKSNGKTRLEPILF